MTGPDDAITDRATAARRRRFIGLVLGSGVTGQSGDSDAVRARAKADGGTASGTPVLRDGSVDTAPRGTARLSDIKAARSISREFAA